MVGGDISPDLHRLLMYGRAVDTAALREIFGFEPQYSTEETFEAFRAAVRPGPLSKLGLIS
jgi:UDP-glucose 4-epimerase